jgi:thiosulfate/3-mercaptopyruvate sulfurtransferase
MNPLVTPAWLYDSLTDPNLVILDSTLPPVGVKPTPDVRTRYVEQHIPGAVYFDIEEFSDHFTSLPHMLPTTEEFSRKASALGIADPSTIVIYEQEGVFSAPRAWWMFRTMGARNVFLLNGGLRGWLDAGFAVESGPLRRPAATFQAKLNSAAVKSFADVQQMLTGTSQILDARSAGRFAGTAPEPRPGLSSGHMPGAISVPFTELVEQGSLMTAEKLRQVFRAKGVDLEQPITTTCGSGVTAAVISLALEIAGAENTSLYDGSWAEYAQHPEAVIHK